MFTSATPELILEAYRQGIFPMAEKATDDHYNFYRPIQRGQLSILDIHIPKKLLKKIKQHPYEVRINNAFSKVIDGCSRVKKGRESTWINPIIRNVFIELHQLGHAHSVECWKDGLLVGGLYGLAIGAVFCGESMFSTADDASKIALIHLCARLHKGGFSMLDTQFINEHLEQFGVYEIPQEEYEQKIKTQMKKPADFVLKNLSEDVIITDYLKFRDDHS
ncbi:MAG: leucyl/phenylalanyl-tRNA--protein transferase [Alphaproteobacteria bacterium]|nr:leucyl/phenylalanyl-tRNA--protein transferase [Alphaproteobacteria bacterium]